MDVTDACHRTSAHLGEGRSPVSPVRRCLHSSSLTRSTPRSAEPSSAAKRRRARSGSRGGSAAIDHVIRGSDPRTGVPADPRYRRCPGSGGVAAGVVHGLQWPRRLDTRPALEAPRPPGLRALSRAGASGAGSRRGRGQDGTRDRLRPFHPTSAPAARRTSCGHDRSARSAPLAISFRPTTIGIMELRRDGSGSRGLRIGGGCTVKETPDGSDVQLAAASSMHRAFGTAPSARTAMQAVTLHGGPRAWSRRVAPRPPRRAGHRRHTGSTPAAHGSGPSVNPHGGQKGA